MIDEYEYGKFHIYLYFDVESIHWFSQHTQ